MFDLSLNELLKVNVITSTKNEESLQTVPSSISVFTAHQIRNLGAEYLHELINYVPGFQAYRQGESGAEYFHSSRGHRSSTKSREVLILVDGIRMNREFDNAFPVPMFSLHNVEKIEFIRGPGSALYGSNAVLGVVDIITTRNKNKLEFIVGENDVRRMNVTGASAVLGWQVGLAGSVFDEGGEGLEVEDFYTQSVTDANDPRSGEDIQLRVSKDDSELSVLWYNREAEDFYVSERISTPLNFVRIQHQQFRFTQGVYWSDSLKSDFALLHSKNSFEPESAFGPLGVGDAAVSETNIAFNVDNHWNYRSDQSLTFGLEIRKSDISEFVFNTENAGTILFYLDTEQKIASTYVQNQRQFDSGTKVTVGARYDHYDGLGTAFSPRVGLVHPLTETQTLKALYGEAFRVPTTNELFLENTGGVVGNSNLQPETMKTSELIWIKQWSNQVLNVNVFYNTVSDIISRDGSLAMPTFVNQSSPESFHGFEVEYSLQFDQSWLLTINSSTFRNLPDSDFRQSERLASFILNYSQSRWNFNFSGIYSSSRQFLNGAVMQRLDSYWLMNAKWRFNINPTLGVYALGKNLIDEEYETPFQGPDHSLPVANRGRELAVGLQFQF